jgi:hypothetical protein
MAYRELGMVELREVIRRWHGGAGVRAMARGTGMDRKTIAHYLRAPGRRAGGRAASDR